MRKIILALLFGVFLSIPSSAYAQDTPADEVFAGYSYFNFDPGDSTLDRLSTHGFLASVTGNVNRYFGVEAEVGANWAGDCFVSGLDCSHIDFAGGPKFSFRGMRVTGFVHNLYGVDHASSGISGVSVTDNDLAIVVGGGLDVRANDMLSVRVVQFDYITTNHFDDLGANRQHNFRIAAGVVIALAHR